MKTLWTGVCPCSIFREGEYHFRIITRRERGAAIVLSHGEDIFKTFSKCGRLGALQLPRPQATERESNRREVGVKGLAGDWNHLYTPNAGHRAVVLGRGSAGGGEGFTRGASNAVHCHVCLARLVDLHQSKRTRLQHSYYKGCWAWALQTTAFLCLGYALGPVFDLELHTRAKRVQSIDASVCKPVYKSNWRERESG